jgi:hypothetical protein
LPKVSQNISIQNANPTWEFNLPPLVLNDSSGPELPPPPQHYGLGDNASGSHDSNTSPPLPKDAYVIPRLP